MPPARRLGPKADRPTRQRSQLGEINKKPVARPASTYLYLMPDPDLVLRVLRMPVNLLIEGAVLRSTQAAQSLVAHDGATARLRVLGEGVAVEWDTGPRAGQSVVGWVGGSASVTEAGSANCVLGFDRESEPIWLESLGDDLLQTLSSLLGDAATSRGEDHAPPEGLRTSQSDGGLEREESCRTCGRTLEPGWIACPSCPPVACSSCGQTMEARWGTCPMCGKPRQ